MAELKEPQDIQSEADVLYVYYSRQPVARTKSFADGEINVDLDETNNVVGIEILSFENAEIQALKEIATDYGLSVDKLTPLVFASDSQHKERHGAWSVRRPDKTVPFSWRSFGGRIVDRFRQVFSGKSGTKGPLNKV